MSSTENQENSFKPSDSLETLDSAAGQTSVESTTPSASLDATPQSNTPKPASPSQPDPSKKNKGGIKKFFERINIYSLLLGVTILLLIGFTYFAVVKNRQSADKANISSQALTVDDLKKISSTDSSVGDPKQNLNIEANAIFSGTVLVRGGLDVAGALKIGGELALPGISVDGKSTLNQVQIAGLSVSGDTAIQGKLNVQNNLTVNGTATFSGTVSAPQITIDILQLNNDLQLNRHIDAGGSTPSRANGSALGSGGTSSVSGTDTAGTVTINTGGGAPAGCFVTITFVAAFKATPHVIISPASSSAAAIDYYVNRSATNFSVCTASDPNDNTAGMLFDYVVID